MQPLTRTVCALLVGLAALTPLAVAARSPTLGEREAIVHALPSLVRSAPVECMWLKVRVSNGGRYALADPTYMNFRTSRCARYAANGIFILRRSPSWRVVYVGSSPMLEAHPT